MPTTSLNDPIDGSELKLIILKRISDALDKDCTLVNDIAYAGFAMKYSIDLKFLRSKTAPSLIWGSTTENLRPEVEQMDVAELIAAPIETISDSYETDSPNTAREEHSLPIPVMVKTPSGSERRKIHINPPKPKVTI